MDIPAINALFAQTDRELWLVTAAAGTRRSGFISTSVNQASIVPDLPRVTLGVARQHYTWELIEASQAFAVHLLGEEHLEWVWRFGLRSGRDGDKLDGMAYKAGTTGSPVVTGALGWLDCRVETQMEIGDRTVYLAEVLDGRLLQTRAPLTQRQLLQRAPADRLRELKEAMARDGTVDARAIHAWRQSRTKSSS